MVKYILFDLDNTLYSVRHGLDDIFRVRLREYCSGFLGVPPAEYDLLREEGVRRYGTTVGWLRGEHNFTDVEGYFAHIHPEDEVDCLGPDRELRHFIENLPCPSSILTNSPRFHADRTLKKLELEGLFEEIFDIVGNNFLGKPHATAYQRALDALSLRPEETLFIDDMPAYAEAFVNLGGQGLLIDELDTYPNYPHKRIKDLREIGDILT
ncbi:MAG: HAD-IA family hydrolase [Treponema sp.]|nr:HAD-IA family hydrolase [Treponema sp.]